jgi:uncharacterized membrane protein YraQ (UPF0718 family)/YHS domain-containing protein
MTAVRWLGRALSDGLLMAYQVWWALVLGFLISAVVQAWVPRSRIERSLAGDGVRPAFLATGLGAASSSCSYAAVAIARSLFAKGASARSALAFQFASTNLVWELAVVLWVLMGWRFAAAEYAGGLMLIAVMWLLARRFVPVGVEVAARRHAQAADAGHQHHAASSQGPWRARLTSADAWSDVAHNFRGDWRMLWREIVLGFALAGAAGTVPHDVLDRLFLSDAPWALRLSENVVLGPLVAVLSFVCSIGNVPLAAVLWSGGISFAGVIAFLFADLVVLPILVIYRRLYGTAFAVRITALMLVTMVLAALAVDGLFTALGLVPTARPSAADVFGDVHPGATLVLDAVATAVAAGLVALTVRRGTTDPVCGMTVDRAKALRAERDGVTAWFCGPACRDRFLGSGHPEEPHGGHGEQPGRPLEVAHHH